MRWTSFLGQRDSQISGKDLEIGGGKALDSLLARRGPLPIPKPNTESPSVLSKIGFGDFSGALPEMEIEESASRSAKRSKAGHERKFQRLSQSGQE